MPTAEPLDLDLPRNRLGEGIYWHGKTGCLFWVDIADRRLHIYERSSARLRTVKTRLPVGFVFPVGDDDVLAGLADGLYRLNTGSQEEHPLARLDLPEDHRLNDGKCDPRGRLWVGTMNTAPEPAETAALYLFKSEGLVEIEGGYVNANGKAWSPDGTIMYHADTSRGVIWQYDYDANMAAIANKRVFKDLGQANPDGLTVDANGNVYAAIYGGSCVSVFSQSGNQVERIELPVPNVTSCVFGDGDLRTLFITTAYDGMDDAALQRAPLSGHVFSVRQDVAGLPEPGLTFPLKGAVGTNDG